MVTNEFAPQHGGVERLLHERARGFEPKNLTVFSPFTPECDAFDEAQVYRSCRSGRSVANVPILRHIARLVAPMGNCYREHRRRRFDLIECGQAFPTCLFAWGLHWRCGTPYIVWVHGNDLLGPMRYRILRPIIRRSLHQARAIIANSSFTARLIASFGIPPQRVRIIPPMVDTEAFCPAAPVRKLQDRYGVRGKKVVLTVCRLVERKGVDVTIEAIGRLLIKRRDVIYLIVGDGPQKQDLRHLAKRLNLEKHVVFCGSIPDDELAAHYNLASIFVMPSRYLPSDASVEGLGLVFLEAMASGLPVIAGNSGGVTDIVRHGENGLLVDPSSVLQLTDAIDRLLSDEEFADQLGRNGLSFVRRPRDWGVLEV